MFTRAISSGIDYLQTQQQEDGSFLSLSSSSRFNFQKAFSFRSPFATALILSCLTQLEETPVLKRIKQNAAAFLLKQKSDIWSFNYWARGSKEAREKPYPDDLDDTFCALSALYQYDPKLIDGRVLAKIVMLLTATEEREGGPYRTWLVKEDAPEIWKDIDVAVNSNIAYFLFLQEIKLPNLNTFIESRIESSLSSSYYPTVFPLIYFNSRFYKGEKREKLIKMLSMKENRREYVSDPLSNALRVSAILNFNGSPQSVDKNISELLHTQTKGFWNASGFCIDPARKGKTYYAGSPELTTAFCLEAISKYLKRVQTQPSAKKADDLKAKQIRNQVIDKVNKRFLHFSQVLRSQAKTMLEVIEKMDEKNQITLLPYFFKMSLGKNSMSLSDKLLVLLGAANTFGWIAYTIYDNFWDEEGDPKTLAIANIALRELTEIFHTLLPSDSGFHEVFQRIMDDIEWSNTWEVIFQRSPGRSPFGSEPLRVEDLFSHLPGGQRTRGRWSPRNYTMLARKSLGHALGPLAMLFVLGYKRNSIQVKHTLSFFTNYLIARQFNDDAHDWQMDLKKGHITPVVAMLIKRAGVKLDHLEGEREIREIFWYKTIVGVCSLVRKHARLARKHLKAISIIKSPHVFEELLISLEHAATEALDEREKTIAFIDTYQNKM